MLVESHGPKSSQLKLEEAHRALDEVTVINSCNRTSQSGLGRMHYQSAIIWSQEFAVRKSMRELLELGRSLHTTVPGSSI